MARNYQQGTYTLKNPEKYLGTRSEIRYLSSYEYECWKFFDTRPQILEWGAETVIIKYFNPVKNRQARYIVDAFVKWKDKDGVIHEALIEIKPESQTRSKPPVKGRKSQKTYLDECATWMVNQAKWQAAQKYAEERGWKFQLLTENQIFRG